MNILSLYILHNIKHYRTKVHVILTITICNYSNVYHVDSMYNKRNISKQ